MYKELVNSNYFNISYTLGSIFFYFSYFAVDKCLAAVSKKYRDLNYDKKIYVVSNFLKSFILAFITPQAFSVMYQGYYNDSWNNNLIKNLGVFYTIPDTVSLMTLNKMEFTTKMHHMVVVIFNAFSLHNDYSEENIVRCMMIYACFSSYAFIVNFTLAIRFLHENKTLELFLNRLSFIIYSLCCMGNWGWHIVALKRQWGNCDNMICSYSIPLYTIMTLAIIIDDVKLNTWLYEKSNIPLCLKHKNS